MVCCKAEEFDGWCEPLDAVRREDGKEYCNLHASKDSKRGTPEEVNKLIHDLIASAIAGGVECNLSGIVVPNDISFKQYNKDRPLPPINFQEATFSGKADFFGATFSGTADFLSATFSKEANFRAATFSGEADFSSATFREEADFSAVTFSDADFRNATFSGKASFYSATFSGTAFFPVATFSGKASFSFATFSGKAYFSGATFSGEANFSHATFSGETDFNTATFSGEANFSRATFSGETDFNTATFREEADFLAVTFSDADFRNATFGGKTRFSSAIFSKEANFSSATFSKRANFSSATFSKKANFSSVTFSDADFPDATFSKEANFLAATFSGEVHFSHATFRGKALFVETRNHMFNMPALFNEITSTSTSMIIFKGVDFSSVPFSLLETNLAFFRFDKCTWPRKKYSGFFARLINKIQLTSDESAVFYDEIQADRGYAVLPATYKLSSAEQLQRFGMVEDLYRQMKVNSKEEHNEPEASRWHYREKEMFRKKKLGRRYSPSVTTLYWAFSGYGERPVRAGGILLLLFVVIEIVMNGFGLRSGSPPEEIIQGFSLLPDMERIGKVTQAVIEHALFVKDPILKAQPGWSGVLFTCWTKILIPIQSALFILALRNKFRR